MTTPTTRLYVEAEFTLNHEIASITRGLAQQSKRMDHPVHLFLTDGGILASVTLLVAPDYSFGSALDDALDLAAEEIEAHLPSDVDLPDAWSTRLIDHDGMAENLRHAPLTPVAHPSEPVEEDGDDLGAVQA